MDTKLIEKSLRLCITAIEVLHPELSPDEPCIAFEAWESANLALDHIATASQPEDSAGICDHEWIGLYGHPAAFECSKCKALCR